MYEVFPGWVVEREIPQTVINGLASGQYTLHGGVIREAAGTPNGGQIVRHLLPVNSSFDPVGGAGALSSFMPSFSMTQQQILAAAQQTMLLAGLGLAVSTFSFIVLNRKLNQLAQQVSAIKAKLENQEKAKLTVALDELRKLQGKHDDESRSRIIQAWNVLRTFQVQYKRELEAAKSIDEFDALEQLYSVTTLACAYCQAEYNIDKEDSIADLQKDVETWYTLTQPYAHSKLLGPQPEQWLYSDFVDDVSIIMLIEWMDFANSEQKGVLWIDKLRKDLRFITQVKNTARKTIKVGKNKLKFTRSSKGKELDQETNLQEKDPVIKLMQRLVQRRAVFETYIEQYTMLKDNALKPSDIKKRLGEVPEENIIDNYVILQPAAEVVQA